MSKYRPPETRLSGVSTEGSAFASLARCQEATGTGTGFRVLWGAPTHPENRQAGVTQLVPSQKVNSVWPASWEGTGCRHLPPSPEGGACRVGALALGQSCPEKTQDEGQEAGRAGPEHKVGCPRWLQHRPQWPRPQAAWWRAGHNWPGPRQ